MLDVWLQIHCHGANMVQAHSNFTTSQIGAESSFIFFYFSNPLALLCVAMHTTNCTARHPQINPVERTDRTEPEHQTTCSIAVFCRGKSFVSLVGCGRCVQCSSIAIAAIRPHAARSNVLRTRGSSADRLYIALYS